MLQVRFGHSNGARTPKSRIPCRLRKRPFHTCPVAIGGTKFLGMLSLPCLLEHLVPLLRKPNGHTAPRGVGIRTLDAHRTNLTRPLREGDLNHRLAFGIVADIPVVIVVPLGTGDGLRFPINREHRHIKGIASEKCCTLPKKEGLASTARLVRNLHPQPGAEACLRSS